MPITGTDPLSISILNTLSAGGKVKDIPSQFAVSLDQAKRLSRYLNFLTELEKHLPEPLLLKSKQIGLKLLVLSPLVKEEDWEGIEELLGVITTHTTREKIKMLLTALKEKRTRMQAFEEEVKGRWELLTTQEKALNKTLAQTEKLHLKLQEEVSFLKKYDKVETKEFLIEHIGVYHEQFILARRLDSGWNRILKKKGIIEYNELEFVWFVKDIDALAKDFEKRTFRKNSLQTSWDAELEANRNSYYGMPGSADYQLPVGLSVNLQHDLAEVKEKERKIKQEQKTIQEELERLRKQTPESFLESVSASNQLSTKDLARHGELQNKALRWLYERGFVAAAEVVLPNGKRADVIGYNEEGHVYLLEVKVSVDDFMADDKWQLYLDYCDEFFFLINFPTCNFEEKADSQEAGLVMEGKRSIEVIKTDGISHITHERDRVIFLINRKLARKHIYSC